MEHNPNPYAALVGIIRADLDAAGIRSIRDAANRAGIAQTTLERRLRGGDAFRLDELEALARLVGTTASTWLTRAERDQHDGAAARVPAPAA